MSDDADLDDDDLEWLYRLTPVQWLSAARTELAHCEDALKRRAYRPGVTHARRAAGMAANAFLQGCDHRAWGRSYMDHLKAMQSDADVPEDVRSAAETLVRTRPAAPDLVPLGKPDLSSLHAAQAIVAWAEAASNPTAVN